MKILLGFVTTYGSNYRKKIEELNELGLTEIALFLTGADPKMRKNIYRLLERSAVKEIPHVHLRTDMEKWELDYLEEKFGTQVFNIHGKNDTHSFENSQEMMKGKMSKIFVENCFNVPDEEELSKYGGLCIDFSHWQDGVLLGRKEYKIGKMEYFAKRFEIGCSHISAVGDKKIFSNDMVYNDVMYANYSKHFFDDFEEFDYIKNYIDYLPGLISIELENSFKQQLKVKKYLEDMIF